MTEFSKLMDRLRWSDELTAVNLGRAVGHVRNMMRGSQKPHDHTLLYMAALIENNKLKERLKRRGKE